MTGNTEAMAKELASAADTEAIESSEFSADMCDQYDAFALAALLWVMRSSILILRSLSMTAGKLGQKPTAFFGLYGLGTGDWMETWKQNAEACQR